jgi:hypothetical protein
MLSGRGFVDKTAVCNVVGAASMVQDRAAGTQSTTQRGVAKGI